MSVNYSREAHIDRSVSLFNTQTFGFTAPVVICEHWSLSDRQEDTKQECISVVFIIWTDKAPLKSRGLGFHILHFC